MKIEIEINDFFLDEESEIEPTLKQFIIKEVVSKINKQTEKKVDDTITRVVREQISKQLLHKTNKIIDEFIANGKMKSGSSNDPDISVEQYIKKMFDNRNGWGSPSEQIAKLAERFGTELKARYDLMFATQIVKRLDKEGLLKEDIAKMLTEGK